MELDKLTSKEKSIGIGTLREGVEQEGVEKLARFKCEGGFAYIVSRDFNMSTSSRHD